MSKEISLCSGFVGTVHMNLFQESSQKGYARRDMTKILLSRDGYT